MYVTLLPSTGSHGYRVGIEVDICYSPLLHLSLLSQNFAFSSAIGPLSWAYPVEIMNTGIRARGTAITSMAAWISNFMIAQVTPIAFRQIGWKYYLVFAICGFTNAITIYLLFPETKGRTLEEMDAYFAA